MILAASVWMAVFPYGSPRIAEAAVIGSSAVYIDDTFARYENGEGLTFRNTAEARLFLEEYLLQYRIYDMGIGIYTVLRYDNHVELQFPDGMMYDRDRLDKSIREQFGTLKGNSAREQITDMCRRVNEKMVYDEDYADVALPQAMERGRGVCWHFAKIAAVLLREREIPTTVVHGLLDGESHVWLKCRVEDGTILNVDPVEGILDEEHMSHLTLTPYISR